MQLQQTAIILSIILWSGITQAVPPVDDFIMNPDISLVAAIDWQRVGHYNWGRRDHGTETTSNFFWNGSARVPDNEDRFTDFAGLRCWRPVWSNGVYIGKNRSLPATEDWTVIFWYVGDGTAWTNPTSGVKGGYFWIVSMGAGAAERYTAKWQNGFASLYDAPVANKTWSNTAGGNQNHLNKYTMMVTQSSADYTKDYSNRVSLANTDLTPTVEARNPVSQPIYINHDPTNVGRERWGGGYYYLACMFYNRLLSDMELQVEYSKIIGSRGIPIADIVQK